jgi:hypothetical protein
VVVSVLVKVVEELVEDCWRLRAVVVVVVVAAVGMGVNVAVLYGWWVVLKESASKVCAVGERLYGLWLW